MSPARCYCCAISSPTHALVDLDAATITTPEGTQEYVSVRWPGFAEFIHGPRVNHLEYDCGEAVLRRWVYKWLRKISGTSKKRSKPKRAGDGVLRVSQYLAEGVQQSPVRNPSAAGQAVSSPITKRYRR